MSLPFTPDELERAIEDGDVTRRLHPTLPLQILNYSPSVQFSNKWNDITETCRGLILDNDYNIVARPWRKFFNLGQVNLPIQFDTPVEVMDKADGSLGILYPTPDGYGIATRGSFTSEQAIHACGIWKDKYHENRPYDTPIIPGYTYLFEIVYPENRIVLDYGDMDNLILLGAVENTTGYYYGPGVASAYLDWAGPVVDVMPYKTISEANGHLERANAEGYVIRSHNFMVKLKQPDYLELHRLVTNASPKTVWEQLKAGKSKSEIVSAFPDEFHAYVGGMIDPLLDQFAERLASILAGYQNVMESYMSEGDEFDRGEFARHIRRAGDKKYYFLLLDHKPIRDVLWAELKPREDRTTTTEDNNV